MKHLFLICVVCFVIRCVSGTCEFNLNQKSLYCSDVSFNNVPIYNSKVSNCENKMLLPNESLIVLERYDSCCI